MNTDKPMKFLKVLIPVVVYEEHLIYVPEKTTPEQAWNLVVEGNYGSEITRVGISVLDGSFC